MKLSIELKDDKFFYSFEIGEYKRSKGEMMIRPEHLSLSGETMEENEVRDDVKRLEKELAEIKERASVKNIYQIFKRPLKFNRDKDIWVAYSEAISKQIICKQGGLNENI